MILDTSDPDFAEGFASGLLIAIHYSEWCHCHHGFIDLYGFGVEQTEWVGVIGRENTKYLLDNKLITLDDRNLDVAITTKGYELIPEVNHDV